MALPLASNYEAMRVSGLGLDMHGFGLGLGEIIGLLLSCPCFNDVVFLSAKDNILLRCYLATLRCFSSNAV